MLGIGWIIAQAAGFLLRSSSNGVLAAVKDTLIGASDNASKVALKEIDAEIAARQHARDIRLATAGFAEMRFLTFVIAACFVLHLVLVTLDTCFKLGWSVPAFPKPFDEWEGVVILSFFGVQLAGKAINTVGAIFMRRNG